MTRQTDLVEGLFLKNHENFTGFMPSNFEIADKNITTKIDLKKKQTPYTIQKLNLQIKCCNKNQMSIQKSTTPLYQDGFSN